MNIFDITNEDIERLQRGITQDEITDRDTEISRLLGGDAFDWVEKLYLKPDYILPSPTEADIIKYLQASEVPPSQWHPAAQEWARQHKLEPVWEFMWSSGAWRVTNSVMKSYDMFSDFPHRLHADYGEKDAGYVEFKDPPTVNPSDIPYGPFTLEPEVCVWTYDEFHCLWDRDCIPLQPFSLSNDDGLQANNIHHCPNCDGRLRRLSNEHS